MRRSRAWASNNVLLSINISSVCTDWWTDSLYMFIILPWTSNGPVGTVSGGQEMAFAQSTPAKTKKMTMTSMMNQIETEKTRWIDLQFIDVLRAWPQLRIPASSP